MPEIILQERTGTIASLHVRGFGFIGFGQKPHRSRIYFHFADSDGHEFQIGDPVMFDLGLDKQQRARAYNVRLIASTTEVLS